MAEKLRLTREQLASVSKDPVIINQLEKLIAIANAAGSLVFTIKNQAGSADIDDTYTRYTGGGGDTLTLPLSTGSGYVYIVKHTGAAGAVTVAASGGALIDGAASINLAVNAVTRLVDGAAGEWDVL